MAKHRCVILVPYFGRWPAWMPAFLRTCAGNPDVQWVFFTDCEPPPASPPNVRYEPITLAEMNLRATERLGMPVRKQLYSQSDLRPAFGEIFAEFTRGFDFWGHCDIDVLWGRIRHFITDEILGAHDIVTSRRHAVAGHFALFRNNDAVNTFHRAIPDEARMLADETFYCIDESKISRYLRGLLAENRSPVRVYWPEELVADRLELRRRRHGWHWRDGRLLDREENERIYLHFGEWKNTFGPLNLSYDGVGAASRYTVTKYGVFDRPISRWEHAGMAWRAWRGRL